MTPALQKPPDD